MTSMAYTSGDPVALAKALTAYAKANPAFTFKTGFVEGRVIDIKNIHDLARHAFEGRAYRQGHVPDQCSGTAPRGSLNGVGRNLAVVIDQGVKEDKFPKDKVPSRRWSRGW